MNKKLEKIVEDIKKFKETGEVEPEILTIKLEGEEALQFRVLVALADDDKKQHAIKSIVSAGLLKVGKVLSECLLENLLKDLKKED